MNFLKGERLNHFPANWRRIASSIMIAVGLLGMVEVLAGGGCPPDEPEFQPPTGEGSWSNATYGVNDAPQGLHGTSPYFPFLVRQPNCALTNVVLDSTYTSLMQTPNYQDILHSGSGSITARDKFPNGCKGQSTGITSQQLASLGKLSNGDTAYAVMTRDGFAVYFANSTYKSSAQQSYTTISAGDMESAVFGFASADLNGDGIADVVVASETDPSSATLTVFLGKGDGTFTQKQTIAVPLNQSSSTAGPVIGVTIDDMNGDGKQDLIAVTNPISADSGITIFVGNGDGSFPATGIAGPAGAGGQTAVTADFNGDGKKDIATSYGQILLGHGDGTFLLASQSVPEPNGTAGIAAADFNQDGKIDLAFPHQSGTVVDVYFGKGDGTFTYSAAYPVIMGGNVLQSTDLDGDGFPDLFVGNAQGGVFAVQVNSAGFFQSILNQGNGTFGKSRAYFTGSTPLNSFATLYDVADFTGDGKQDLVFVGSADGTSTGTPNLTVLKGAGDGTFQLSGPQSSITGPDFVLSVPAIAAGDLSVSGKNDVVFAWGSSNEGTAPHLSVAMGNGDGTFQPQQDYSIPAQVVALLLVDVNGDKKPDAVFIASADGTLNSTGLYVMLNNGDGSFGQAKLIDSEPTMNYLAAQDVNGDAKTDIVVGTAGNVGSKTPGVGFLYLGNGDGTFQHATSVNSGGLYSQVVAIADMNSDGKPDLVFAGNNANGSAESVTVLLGNGNGTFQAATSTPVSADDQPTGIVIADGNRDGKPDVILAGATSPFYLEGNGDGTFNDANSGNFFVGVGSKHLKSADLTGQGLPSLLLTSGATIQVFVGTKPATSTTTATTTTLQASATSIPAGQSVTFTATVTPQSSSEIPTGTVTFSDGTTNIGTGTLNGFGVATFATSSLAVGTHSIAASYGGDTNFSGSASAAVSVQVTAAPSPDFSVAASPSSQSVEPGAGTSYTLTITPANGSTQTVSLSCKGAPATVTCMPASMSSTLNGTSASQVKFNVTTTGSSAMARTSPAGGQFGGSIFAKRRIAATGSFPLSPTGIFGFFGLLALIFWPRLLPVRKCNRGILAGFAALAFLTIAFGCGGSSKNPGNGGGGNSGTPAGTYTLTLMGTVGSTSHSTNVSLVVQ